jgi:hypothetical protein
LRKAIVVAKKRDVVRRTEINFSLRDEDITEIIAETFPGRNINLARGRAIEARWEILDALLSVYAPREAEKRDLRPLLKSAANNLTALKRGLDDPITRMLVTYAGRDYLARFADEEERRAVRNSRWYCDDTVQRFHQLLSEVCRWMHGSVTELIIEAQSASSFKSRSELIRDVLPPVFVKIFERPCGAGRHSPGNRFIVAVLRKGRVHNGSAETIMSLVVKTRQRAKKKAPR